MPAFGVHIEHVTPQAAEQLAGAHRRRPRNRISTTYRTYVTAPGDTLGAQMILPASDNRIRAEIYPQGPATGGAVEVLSEPANPALGSAYTLTVNTPEVLLAAYFQLTTGATVGNRFADLTITDAAGNIIDQVVTNVATAASSTAAFSADVGNGPVPGSPTADAVLPAGLVLQPGWQVVLGAIGLTATDQISHIVLVFQQSTAFGWIASAKPQVSQQEGARITPAMSKIDTRSQGFVYLQSDPGASAPLTVTVIADYDGEPRFASEVAAA